MEGFQSSWRLVLPSFVLSNIRSLDVEARGSDGQTTLHLFYGVSCYIQTRDSARHYSSRKTVEKILRKEHRR